MNKPFSFTYFAFVMFFVAGCKTIIPAKPYCVLEEIPDRSKWRDSNAEVCIQFSGDSAQYWIDGYRNESACCWTLHHLRHEPHRCVFLCEAPQAEWFMSRKGDAIQLEKNSTGRKLPQSYTFTRVP